jgi:hypothetical protein
MSEPPEGLPDSLPEMFYIGTERPENVDAPEAQPLLRITVVWIPVDDVPGKLGAISVGMEISEPLPANVLNTRELFGVLHRLLPSMERKVRAEWVEWRKQAAAAPEEP